MTTAGPRPPRGPRVPRRTEGSSGVGDPFGIGPITSLLAPILSVIGLLLVAVVTFNLLSFRIPFVTGRDPVNGGNGGPTRTAAPSGVVITPDTSFKLTGSIVYAKAGNIWVQDANGARQLTSSGGDSMPSWSPDGSSVYYIRTKDADTTWRGERYLLRVPELMRVPADGSAEPERLATGRFRTGNGVWAYWLRQPVLSPDGKTIALITDAPNPELNNVVLQFFNTTNGKITSAGLASTGVLGHQDPEWRADGAYLLYVKNGRSGSRGAPIIARYDTATKKTKALTASGYTSPSYSPDGRYIAATRTSNLGTDIVVLDANNGRELARITRDDASFSPTWSPAGDGIAFLHLVGQTVDLRLARLDGASGSFAVEEILDLTEVSGLDAESRPDWFVPAADLPPPTPTPIPSSAAPSASASP